MGEDRYPAKPVLLVDDEVPILRAAERAFAIARINNVVTCSDSAQVQRLLDETEFSAVTLDLVMPGMSGLELLPIIRRRQPDASVVVVTATSDTETAAPRVYTAKPVDPRTSRRRTA